MQNGVNIGTRESELNIVYGMINLRKERELARASVKYILTDLNDIRHSYIRLGFHLYECRQQKYYEDFGFVDMDEFCEKNFGMDKSSVSRCINVFLSFCPVTSSSLPQMGLDERWNEYSYSQLVEMLPLSHKQRLQIKPNMTIKQIREMKKDMKKAIINKVDFAVLDEAIDKVNNSVATSQQKVRYSDTYCKGVSGVVRNQYYKKCVAVSKAIDIVDADGKPLDGMYNVWADVLEDKNDHIVIRLHKKEPGA